MQVLIIDNFNDPLNGTNVFSKFKKLIKTVMIESCSQKKITGKSNFITRKSNQLKDLICDWENTILDENTKKICRYFDKIDIIFIGGDLKFLPWNPSISQLITLINMCNQTLKPVFSAGSGAFTSIYATSTSGLRMDIMNGPNGNSGLESLPMYPKYGEGLKNENPCGWLENETGDVYIYNKDLKVWKPSLNIGMYSIPSSGIPSRSKVTQVTKNNARTSRLANTNGQLDTLNECEVIANVQSKYVQHYSIKNFKQQDFVAAVPRDWYLNNDGSLPTNKGLYVIAYGPRGPMLLGQDNKLFFPIDIASEHNNLILKKIMSNYVEHILDESVSKNKLDLSLYQYLYGRDDSNYKGPVYISGDLMKPVSRPLQQLAIQTQLTNGPTKVPANPQFNIIKNTEYIDSTAQAILDFEATQWKSIIYGDKPPPQLRDPSLGRQTRLNNLLDKQGDFETRKVAEQVLKESLKLNMNSLPASASSNNNIDSTNHLSFQQSQSRNVEIEQNNPRIHFYERENESQANSSRKSTIHTSNSPNNSCSKKHNVPNIPGWDKVSNESQKKNSSRHTLTGNISARTNSSRVSARQASNFLPHNRPLSSRLDNVDDIVYIPYQESSGKIYSNYHQLEEKGRDLDEKEKNSTYQGQYTELYRSEVEQYLHEYNEAKKGFIAGPFKTQFGTASAIPLRKEGGVTGPYPKPPSFGKEACKAVDWNMFSREEDKTKRPNPDRPWLK